MSDHVSNLNAVAEQCQVGVPEVAPPSSASSSGRAMSFAEELPVYASKIQQTIEPISRKIQSLQQSAGSLTNDVHPTKKVPEVRLQESPTWPDYLVRGV